jgi:hypothetical protein
MVVAKVPRTMTAKTRKIARKGPLTRLFERLGYGVGGEGRVGLATRSLGEVRGDSRGAIFVEYVALLCLVSVGGAAAVVVLGAPLVALSRFTQLVVGLPIP